MWPKAATPCCVGLFDIWPDAYTYLGHLIPRPGYSLATIIGAVLAALLTLTVISGIILLTSLINPVGPACTCDILDYGLVSWRSFAGEGAARVVQGVWTLSGPGIGSPLIYSSTSNPSKFNLNVGGPIPPGNRVVYTPVFVGTTIRLSGVMTLSFVVTLANIVGLVNAVSVRTATAWSNNGGATWTNLSEGVFDIVSPVGGTPPAPNSTGMVTLPFAITLTKAQVPSGSVAFTMLHQINVNGGTADVFYGNTSLSILVDEL